MITGVYYTRVDDTPAGRPARQSKNWGSCGSCRCAWLRACIQISLRPRGPGTPKKISGIIGNDEHERRKVHKQIDSVFAGQKTMPPSIPSLTGMSHIYVLYCTVDETGVPPLHARYVRDSGSRKKKNEGGSTK
jgi:hypothetical protein